VPLEVKSSLAPPNALRNDPPAEGGALETSEVAREWLSDGDSESGRSWIRTRDLFLIRHAGERAQKGPKPPFPSGMIHLPPPL